MQVFKNNVSLEATPTGDTHIVNKAYLEDRISKINVQHAIKVDELPICTDNGDGTYTISYVKDGTAKTTTDTSQWFYYLDNNSNLKQTIFLEGEELTIDGTEIALDDYVGKETFENTISELEANFADGVNTIYDAIVLKGQTPLDKSPQSISNAIGNITTGEGATGIFDTLPYTKMKVTSTANATLDCSNAPIGYSKKGICIMSNGVNTGNSMTFAVGENEIEQLGSYCVGTSNGNSYITDIDVQELSRVETLYFFMHGSSKLKSLVFSGKVDTSKCTNMSASFRNNTLLESLDVSKFDTSNVTTMRTMFEACYKLLSLDLSHFDVRKCTNLSAMFRKCTSLKYLNTSGWQLDSITTNPLTLYRSDGSQTLYGSTALETLIANDMGSKSTATVSMARLLEECPASHIEVNNLNIPNVTNLMCAFNNCPNLTVISFKNLYAPKVTTLEGFIRNCPLLETVDFTGWSDTSNVTTTYQMFLNDKGLKVLDLRPLNLDNVTNSSDMFSGCTALEELDLSNWNTAKLATRSNMFKNVPTTCVIKVGANWTLTEAQTGFAGTFTVV